MKYKKRPNIKVSKKPVKRNAIYGVGIDVHKHNLTAAISEKKVDEIKIVKVQSFTTNDVGYEQFWAFVSKYQPKTFVFEASGVYSTYFYNFLQDRSRQNGMHSTVVRLNPRVAKQMHFASTNHNDPVDAKSLAIIAVIGIAQPYHGLCSKHIEKVKELTRTYIRYGWDCTRIKNRIKRLLDRSGIYLRELDLESSWGCFFIESMARHKGTVSDAINQVLLDKNVSKRSKTALEKRSELWSKYQTRILDSEYQALLDMLVVKLVFLNNCTINVEELLNKLLDSDENLQKRVGFIASVPGLSIVSALSILAEIEDIRRFDNYRKFLNYAGLAPTIHISGESQMKGRINRKSNKFLRTTFYKAGEIIAKIVKERSDLKDYAGRMQARYTKGKIIYFKIAVKVARTVFSLLKRGEWYNPCHESQHVDTDIKKKRIATKIKNKSRSFRKIANWLIRKKDYLPDDVITRMRTVLKID